MAASEKWGSEAASILCSIAYLFQKNLKILLCQKFSAEFQPSVLDPLLSNLSTGQLLGLLEVVWQLKVVISQALKVIQLDNTAKSGIYQIQTHTDWIIYSPCRAWHLNFCIFTEPNATVKCSLIPMSQCNFHSATQCNFHSALVLTSSLKNVNFSLKICISHEKRNRNRGQNRINEERK